MKILCLHGMGCNARIFEAQTNQILQPLRDEGHEFIFVDGIVPYEPPDGMHTIKPCIWNSC